MTMLSRAAFLWMQISHDNEFLFEMDGFEARVLYHSHTLHIVLKALDSQKKILAPTQSLFWNFSKPLNQYLPRPLNKDEMIL